MLCEWVSPGAALRPVTAPTWGPRPEPAVTVGIALTKGEHPEWAVQKLTEVGADRIVVLTTERCVTRWVASGAGRHLERLREVARQAAMQSRRSWLPTVEGPVAFSALVSGEAGGAEAGVALAVQGGVPLTLATPMVLVGPEGGWSDEELGAVPVARHVSLGPNVLRAETAAMAAGVLLVALRAGLVAPPAAAAAHSHTGAEQPSRVPVPAPAPAPAQL